jgi:threonine/homoserine/homoserine lactone efflux protein
MEDPSYWMLFLSAAILLNIAPGPDMLYLISKTLSQGKRVGFASILGFGTGALIHTLFVSLGISAIISTSVVGFKIIKYTGAAYLFYLGIKALLSGGIKFKENEKKEGDNSFLKSFSQAVIIDVTNPKVALFFIAFLPQFYRVNGTSKIIQFMTLGLIIILIGFIVESIIVLLSDKIAHLLKKKPIVSRILDKVFGTVLIGLGIRLVIQKD